MINDRYGIAEDTSARVRAVIEEMGYHASLVGQSLRSRRTNVLGVLVRDIEPFSAELLKGIARAVHATGYELVVFSGSGRSRDQAGWERRYLSRISGTLADGAILVTPHSIDEVFGSPVVAVDHNVHSSTLPTVDSDNLNGAVSATEYLIGLGHRRIAFLAGRPDLESARHRERGYRQALEHAGITVDESLIRTGGYEAETATEPARELLEHDPRPTAIFAANDAPRSRPWEWRARSASRSRTTSRSSGSTTSPSPRSRARRSRPSSSRSSRWASEAVRLLIDLIANPSRSPARVVLPTRLVVRQSCRAIADDA